MKKFIYLQEENGNFQKYEYENISDLNEELKKRKITIGDRAKIGECAKIGADAKIGARATIGEYNSFFAVNLYKYTCGAWIENRGEIIQLGCFTRTRKEWESDFWNNPKEFPNDNSEKSNARLMAFKMCCTFLDLIKNK